MLLAVSMTATAKRDFGAKPEEAPRANVPEQMPMPSPAVASGEARRGSNRLWWSLLAAFVLIVGLAVAGVASRTSDRGIRGPADQGAPDAPRSEKVPPSAER
jgi:hypothetical protein